MAVVASGEQGAPRNKLRENTANGPQIHSLREFYGQNRGYREREAVITHLGVHLERQHNFGSTVPPGGDVFSHSTLTFANGSSGLDTPRQPEITDFEVTVSIEEKVCWLQVTVNNVRTMNRLEGTKSLIDKVLAVVIGEVLRPNDSV